MSTHAEKHKRYIVLFSDEEWEDLPLGFEGPLEAGAVARRIGKHKILPLRSVWAGLDKAAFVGALDAKQLKVLPDTGLRFVTSHLSAHFPSRPRREQSLRVNYRIVGVDEPSGITIALDGRTSMEDFSLDDERAEPVVEGIARMVCVDPERNEKVPHKLTPFETAGCSLRRIHYRRPTGALIPQLTTRKYELNRVFDDGKNPGQTWFGAYHADTVERVARRVAKAYLRSHQHLLAEGIAGLLTNRQEVRFRYPVKVGDLVYVLANVVGGRQKSLVVQSSIMKVGEKDQVATEIQTVLVAVDRNLVAVPTGLNFDGDDMRP